MPPCHVSNERSGDDRSGTVAVTLMLQGGGAGVHDVRDMVLVLVSCRIGAKRSKLSRVPDRHRHSSKAKHEGAAVESLSNAIRRWLSASFRKARLDARQYSRVLAHWQLCLFVHIVM